MPDTNYEGMLTVIEGLETGAKKGELCFVDISGVLGSEERGAATGYGEMLETVEDVESRQQKGAAVKQQAARQSQAREERVMTTEVTKVEQAPKRESMREEMKNIVSALPAAKPRFGELRIKRINTADLVLPNLPISDQIRELEQIVAALKEHALDDEQMKVARLELTGLKQHVKELGDELARENRSLSALDRSLWDMRGQRLSEAVSLIGGVAQ